MANGKDSDWWPSIESPEKAVRAMKFGAFTATLSAVLTAGINVAAIYLQRPVLGMNGWGLVDAALFAIVAWRVYRLSLPWSIVGLVMFTAERLFGFVHNPSLAGLIVAVLFFPYYLNAVRGGLYLRGAKTTNAAPTAAGLSPFTDSEAQRERAGEKEDEVLESSQDEHAEFLAYMGQSQRKFRQPGVSFQDEYDAWLKDRRKRQVAARAAR